MTYEQALNKLDETVIKDRKLKGVLSKALDKQIPKKTIFWDGCPRIYLCGSCRYCIAGGNDPNVPIITVTLNPYCPNCGQLIDWSGVE